MFFVYIILVLSVSVVALGIWLCSFLEGYWFYLNSFVLGIS